MPGTAIQLEPGSPVTFLGPTRMPFGGETPPLARAPWSKPLLVPDPARYEELKRRPERGVLAPEAPFQADTMLAASAPALLAPAVRTSFEGIDFNGTVGRAPPDVSVAVGPSHVVETVNTQIAVYDKSGALISNTLLESFFGAGADDRLFDPKVVYDPKSGRFFLVAVGYNAAANAGKLWIAASGTSDPRPGSGWNRWLIT